MAFDFPDLPPFPDDVPTAPLLRLSLQKLIDNEPEEIKRLWEACRDVGFFYLDLRGAVGHIDSNHPDLPPIIRNGVANSENNRPTGVANGNHIQTTRIDGNAFISDATRLFGVSDEFFDLPVEEKVKYDFKDQGSYFGYKGYGAGIIDKVGTRDRNEFYNVSKDDILSISKPIRAPKLFDSYRPLLRTYIANAHAIVTLLLTRLEELLQLPHHSLTNLHAINAASGDQVRFVRSPPQPILDRQAALGAHTDFGSVTLLFNRLGGLQILPPAADGLSEEQKRDQWLWVRPLNNHCVVNLGDAMVKFTKGLLRSNIHRVVNPPGEQQGELTRTSLVYFSRPSDDVMLKPLEDSQLIASMIGDSDKEEEIISSKEWVLRRALGRRGVGDWEKSGGTEEMRGMREVSVRT